MMWKTGWAFLIAFVLAGVVSGRAADIGSGVDLKTSAPLAKDLAAFPRLAVEEDAAGHRINGALAAADARARAFVKDCAAQEGEGPTSVTRSIVTTMRGPRFLSFVANNYYDCRGAHPDTDTIALVYDLTTGAPVNWSALLPPTFVGKSQLETAGDGTRIGTISSSMLRELYLKGHKIDPECVEPLSDSDLTFILWPDAEQGGVAIQPASLPHVVAACGDSWTIPLPELRQLGAKAELIDAIAAAHDRHLYEAMPK